MDPALPHMRIAAGTVIFRPDDQCTGFIIVHEGVVRVVRTAENGREIVLYRVRPGDICLQTFACMVEGRDYSAEAVAEADVTAEIVPPAEFARRMAGDPAFRDQLFAAVAHRFNDLEQLVEDVALTGIAARLARLLLRLADADGLVTATHEQLATEAASGRAVITRQIGRFARDGWVEAARGQLRITDRAGLEKISHEV